MRKGTAVVALALLVIGACGPRDDDPVAKHEARAVQVQQWQGSEQLKTNKNKVIQAAKAQGADDATVCLLLAMGMLETNDMTADQRDASKDGDGNSPSMNVSLFNMNKDYLGFVGFDMSKANGLNDDNNIADAVRALLDGFKKFGVDKTLCFHRGGRQSFLDMCSYGAQEYISTIKSIQQFLIANPALQSDSTRASCYVEHV